MKIFPIGTSRLHEPLSLICESVNFPGFGYFHSPSQIKDLLSVLLGERHLSVEQSRFFFRKDQTPTNKFQTSLWQDGLARDAALQRAISLFNESDVIVVEISSLKSFIVNSLAVQGNPNYYHNISYKDIWNKNYYEDYHPEIQSHQTADESEIQKLFSYLSDICSKRGKKAIVLGHLVDPKQPNATRKALNELLQNSTNDFRNINYFETEKFVDQFGFRVLENGSVDIHHLPWIGLEALSDSLYEVARKMCLENSNIGISDNQTLTHHNKGSGIINMNSGDSKKLLEALESSVKGYKISSSLFLAERLLQLKVSFAEIKKHSNTLFINVPLCCDFLSSKGLTNLAKEFESKGWQFKEEVTLFKLINAEKNLDKKVALFHTGFDWCSESMTEASKFSSLFISSARYNAYLYNALQIHSYLTSGTDKDSYIRCMFRLGQPSEILGAYEQNKNSSLHDFFFTLASGQLGFSSTKNDNYTTNDEYSRLNAMRALSLSKPQLSKRNRPSGKLRVALCISGQLRGAVDCLPKWLSYFNSIATVDSFLATWDRNPNPNIQRNTMGRVFDGDIQKRLNNVEDIDKLLPIFNSLFTQDRIVDEQYLSKFNLTESKIINETEFEKTIIAKFGNVNKYVSNQLKMFYMIEQAFKLVPSADEYDLIIRLRPDLNFVEVAEADLHVTSADTLSCYVLMNQVDGIDDKFALMDGTTAKTYSSIYSRFESQGLNYLDLDYAKFAESLVLRHLYAEGITPKLLTNYKFGGLSNGQITREEVLSRMKNSESLKVNDSDFEDINNALGLLL